MPISFKCSCGAALKTKDELAGRSVKCPKCGKPVKIPAPASPSPSEGDVRLVEEAPEPTAPAPAEDPGTTTAHRPNRRPPGRSRTGTQPPVSAEATGAPLRLLKPIVGVMILDSIILGILGVMAMNAVSGFSPDAADKASGDTYESYLKELEDSKREHILQEEGTFVSKEFVAKDGKTFFRVNWLDRSQEKRYDQSLIQSRAEFEKSEGQTQEFVKSFHGAISGMWWTGLLLALTCLVKGVLSFGLLGLRPLGLWGVIVTAGVQSLLLTIGIACYGMKGYLWSSVAVNASTAVMLVVFRMKILAR